MAEAKKSDAPFPSNILSVKQFTREHVDKILSLAESMQQAVATKGTIDICKGLVLGNLFYEPSTRTSTSFHVAMLRLGGQCVTLADTKSMSVAKGETLADTVRCLSSYMDAIVLRHPTTGAAAEAASHLSIPLINAGDGIGEHPTQACLDLFTIKAECGKIEGLTVTMLGDLKHGRTVHSLAHLLSRFPNVKINYVSPNSLKMPAELVAELKAAGVQQQECSLKAALGETDVLYVTRVQKERFADPREYEAVADAYTITPDLLDGKVDSKCKAKSTLRILHPLPRVNEISPLVDSDPRAAYFRQMKYGMFVRMALLSLVLKRADRPF